MKTIHALAQQDNVQGKVISKMVDRIEATAARILDAEVAEAAKKGRVLNVTDWMVNSTEISLVIDLLKAMQNYIKNDDELVDMTIYNGPTGFEIGAHFRRDGHVFFFETEAIYAGGYNIQRLHIRYIVKSRLQRVSSTIAAEAIAEKKRLTKIEKLQNELIEMQTRRDIVVSELEESKKMTRDQIIEILKQRESNRFYFFTTYATIDKQMLTEEEFIAMQQEGIEREISSWIRFNVSGNEWLVKQLNKSIAKTEAKLAAI